MSPTTPKGRAVGASVTALALLASAPLSIAASERASDAPRFVAENTTAKPAPRSTPQIEFTPAPTRFAQASPTPRATNASAIRPVYLRLSADTDAGFQAALTRQTGSSDQGQRFRYDPRAEWVNRTFDLHVTSGRAETINVTEDHTTRQVSLDPASRAALNPIVADCRARLRANNRLSVFSVNIASDTPTLYGEPYLVYCYPGERIDKQTLTSDRNIEGLMASDDIEIGSRNARAAGMFFGHQIRKFEASTPNPTRQQVYENCVAVRSEANRRFSYPSSGRSTAEAIAASCRRSTDRKFDAAP